MDKFKKPTAIKMVTVNADMESGLVPMPDGIRVGKHVIVGVKCQK